MSQAIDFLQGLLAAVLCPQEVSVLPILYRLRTPLLLPQQVASLEADWRTRLPHLGDFQPEGRKLPHTLVSVSEHKRPSDVFIYIPNRRFPRRAYAFLRAAVFQRGSWKSLDKSFWVDDCSRCHDAIRQSPIRMFFFLSAR